ncbi:hypothetical protein RG58_15420 [Escherichia coli]|nr:hypothetical protein RG56_15435 [Escherichia coli]EFN7274952.1 hypothetical protein [Escherichia coli O7:H7]APL14390.1 hypothetical protein RG58_15420 [Escherichia coli]APL21365.1 hypothetical protein RG60_00490 [Escherichia coli]APL27085.1 hypothetical protein RG61_04400 [Escherichia coli]
MSWLLNNYHTNNFILNIFVSTIRYVDMVFSRYSYVVGGYCKEHFILYGLFLALTLSLVMINFIFIIYLIEIYEFY